MHRSITVGKQIGAIILIRTNEYYSNFKTTDKPLV